MVNEAARVVLMTLADKAREGFCPVFVKDQVQAQKNSEVEKLAR
jgi:hypothetical protein